MYWFLSAFAVAAAILLFAPRSASVSPDPGRLLHQTAVADSKATPMLLLITLGISLWLLLLVKSQGGNSFVWAAPGFVLTAAIVAIPTLRRFLLPVALGTGLLLALICFLQLLP
ncbi:hypothetical protein [Shewanella cyperi]|uniref:hypothetical protein n=1 Tax=Shewanella cyperi TaxID=2814292 RepID=UPI001A950B56|nr:hypothetical protein [Shewanella cyperi]QSX41749.1 hypothetical protein JYB84_04830 [Shewanella cyperi]